MRAKLPPGTLDKLWNDPKNWQSRYFYVCKEDPRIIVPKRDKWRGWTINFARPRARLTLAIVIALPLLLIFSIPNKRENILWVIVGILAYAALSAGVGILMCSTKRYEEEP